MTSRTRLTDEIGEPPGKSRAAIELCCAIVEDVAVAREFELAPRSASELFSVAMPGPAVRRSESLPLPRELTNLLA